MAEPDADLIGPDDIAYRLELTPRELKVTWAALRSLHSDLGHDEHDVRRLVRTVLDKLPPAASIEGIDLGLPRRSPRL